MSLYRLAVFLWWSKFRGIFEPIARRLLQDSEEIKTGPLRGYKFKGGLAQMLGIYEYTIQSAINRRLGRGGIFYDIGANTGFFTLFAAQCVGMGGHVYSFEPLPKNIASIKNAIQNNNLPGCHLEECAITDFVGETDLYYTEDIATPSIAHKQGNEFSSLRVSAMTLDQFTRSHLKPALIKLDVEGAEIAALKGAGSLIASNSPPAWIIEIHNPQDESEIFSLLAPGNYLIEKLSKPGKKQDSFPIHIVASRHEK